MVKATTQSTYSDAWSGRKDIETHSGTVCPVTLILVDSLKMFLHFHGLLQNWSILWFLGENYCPLKCIVSISKDNSCNSSGLGSHTSVGCLDVKTRVGNSYTVSVTESHYIVSYANATMNPLVVCVQSENFPLWGQRVIIPSTKGQSCDVPFQRKPVIPVKQLMCTNRLAACWLP